MAPLIRSAVGRVSGAARSGRPRAKPEITRIAQFGSDWLLGRPHRCARSFASVETSREISGRTSREISGQTPNSARLEVPDSRGTTFNWAGLEVPHSRGTTFNWALLTARRTRQDGRAAWRGQPPPVL